MKRLVVLSFAVAAALVAFSSCKEKINTDGGGSSFIFTDGVDNLTHNSVRCHAHFNGTKGEGDFVGIICDKKDQFNPDNSPRESSVVTEDGTFYVSFFGLDPDTEYEYMAYAQLNGKESRGKKRSFRTEGIPVSSVTVTAPATILYMEDNKPMTLTVEVLPENASDKSVNWSSSNNSIATVSSTGVVTGKSGGEVTITATSVQNSSKFGSCKITVKPPKPSDAVDLGLPSGRYWRDRNLDASSSSATGNYYAWAETSSKSSFTLENYKWKPDGHIMYEKYQGSYSNSYNDGDKLTYLKDANYVDDAARQKLGGTWRIPSGNDWYELKNNCTMKKESNGIRFTAKKKDRNGNYNSIFFPFGGYKYESTAQYPDVSVYSQNQGYYWGDEVRYRWYNASPDNFSALMFAVKYGSACNASDDYKWRYYGAMIRPVCD